MTIKSLKRYLLKEMINRIKCMKKLLESKAFYYIPFNKTKVKEDISKITFNKSNSINNNYNKENNNKETIFNKSNINSISLNLFSYKEKNKYFIKYDKGNYLLFYILLFIIIISQIKIAYSHNRFLYSKSNEITIKIIGNGTQKIVNGYCPNEIYINETKVEENTCYINLTEQETIIRMVWLYKLSSCISMFYNLGNIKEIDLSKFDSSNVKSTAYMFQRCGNLKSINFNNFNTSSVTDIRWMFNLCQNLETLDISNFDTSKVTSMESIFYNCSSLKSLNLSNFITSSVTNMDFMFSNCNDLELLDISNFDTSKVISMGATFQYCESLKSLNLSHFNTSSVTDIGFMFGHCFLLETLDISNFDTSKVTKMQATFTSCESLKSLNLSHFNTSNVNNMIHLFSDSINLELLDISNFDTSKVTSMYSMFASTVLLNTLNLSHFNTPSLTNMDWMFYQCQNLEILDISNFDTSKVTTMTSTFYVCVSLKSLNLSNFNTSSVTNMEFLFSNCDNLELLDISKFDTSKVTSMRCTFQYCESLKSLNLSHFNTSSTTNMRFMFGHCFDLEILDISNFDTSKVNEMRGIFVNCQALKSLNLSSFNISNINDINYFFYGCLNLEYLNLENCIENNNLVYNDIFYYVPENIVYCINETNAPIISSFLKNKKCSINYCLDDWKENQIKFSYVNGEYICEISSIKDSTYLTNLISTTNINDINSILEDINETEFISTSNTNEFAKIIDTTIPNEIKTIFTSNENSYILNNHTFTELLLISETINESKQIFTNESSYLTEYNNKIDTTTINLFYTNSTVLNKFTQNIENNEIINYCNITDFYDKKCNDCLLKIRYISENLTTNIIYKFVYDYINETSINLYKLPVNHYINNHLQFSITIFNTWYCTNLLLEYDYFEINSNLIFDKINNKSKNTKDYIFVYINMKHKNYIEIYDKLEENKININLICPDCLKENDLILKNNYTNEIYSELGKAITYKIINNNIDPFKKNNQIFNDICKNFTIKEIDIPLKERRQIIFLGHKKKEIICNDLNCNIEYYYLSNFTSICKCKISNDFNYLISNDYNNQKNEITYEEYQSFINSKSKINSFLILKCGKEAFKLNNIKINQGFYISIIFLFIYFILYIIHYYIYFKKKFVVKFNPPKIQKFEINDDFEYEENEDSKSKKPSEKENGSEKVVNEINTVNIYKNIDLKQMNNDENEKNIDNNNININIKDNYEKKQIMPTNGNNDNIYFLNKNEEKQTIYDNASKKVLIKNTKRSIKNRKNLPPINKITIPNSEENLVKTPEKKNIEENNNDIIIISPNIKSSISFIQFYWKYLKFEQPIINLFETIPYIPIVLKLMRIIFILFLNIFFNIFHLDQKYFRKKYIYFNDKYNIINDISNNNISLNERFKYGFSHSIVSGLISFLTCFIIQSILNYFIFKVQDKIMEINNLTNECNLPKKRGINNKNINTSENKDNIKNNNIDIILKNKNKKYFIFFAVSFLIMIFISYSMITFNEVYRGGITDLISGLFWTFIFLQLIPFIYCFILAFIEFRKNKIN